MKKLAIFVEGYTEVLFLEQLLPAICGNHQVIIEHKDIKGGGKKSNIPKRYSVVKAAKNVTNEQYYVLIINCGGDKLVAQRIREEHQNLTTNGYSKIIGIRDVRPDFTHAQISKLEIELKKYIKTSLISVEFVLSVMEFETWFLAEFTHFEKVDPTLNLCLIKSSLGFDPSNDDMQLRLEPQKDLNNCYLLANKTYEKSKNLTVNNLDYAHIYVDVKNKIPHLKILIDSIDDFLA